jgi:hypothetical protein
LPTPEEDGCRIIPDPIRDRMTGSWVREIFIFKPPKPPDSRRPSGPPQSPIFRIYPRPGAQRDGHKKGPLRGRPQLQTMMLM